ncbi:unnamed protein product [Rotaria socialis]|uniref:Transferrin receptor-like dimerisation domain-containing protein n=1 Tax=Rotaria socialis TaxID=392032 RepID=A0A821EWB3_9BILA|nr:unnamed protein product [Rotaria socialis]CAF4641999.1 unnamed protein product [Rotaria socialis]
MRQLGNEEKAALLLASPDDDANELSQSSTTTSNQINNPIVSKRPKTYQRGRTSTNSSTHPILFFILILCAFILGCLTGVAILLYRMSQDAESSSATLYNSPSLTEIDLTIQTKVFQSLKKTNFLNLNRSIESESDAANKLELNWKSLSSIFNRVNKLSYDLTLSKYAPSVQWSGIQLLDRKNDQEIEKFNVLTTNDYLSFSSLIKSGKVMASYIYYANYGRQEDFAYLINKNQINFENNNHAIVFMRRKLTIISQTKQIHQAIHYGFAGLVLFDDDDSSNDDQTNQNMTITNDRHSFSEEWGRLSTEKQRENFLDGISNDDDQQISVLILSYSDVDKIFSFDSNPWLPCPSQWHNKPSSLKLGGELRKTKLHLTTFMEEVPVHLPLVLGYIRGIIDVDHFIMIGYQLGRKQQEKVIDEIIHAYGSEIKNGWRPRRSILFCAWSGLSYDRYTIRRWISDNYRLIDRNLIAYIDLGNGIIGNSTLNLHGSPLLQRIAQRAADVVVSPLIHNHTCHHRRKPTIESHSHVHRRRRHEEHENHVETNEHKEQTECEPHKLFDEWMRASNNRIGSNKTSSIIQMIDIDSAAALFLLEHGIPSLLIEMTDEQALTKDTFYLQNAPPVFSHEIEPDVIVAYAQFVSEIIRQLVDEPLIPFDLTNYADSIDMQTIDYLAHYDRAYQALGSHLGDSNEMTKIISQLTKVMRQIQSNIDQIPKNNYFSFQIFNEKLIEFERLFINDDQLRRTNTADNTYKHVLIGPAFGLTNTAVPFPLLSNLLFGIPTDPQTQLCDASQLYWSRLKQHFRLITRTLNGFDGLLSNF